MNYSFKEKNLLWVLYLIPIFFFLYFIIVFTVNAPRGDEFSIFTRISAFENQDNFISKIVELSKKGTEHVPIYFQSIYTLYYKLFGPINFQILAFFANFLLLPGIILLVFKNFNPKQSKLFLFLPFLWIMLSSNYWLVAHWSLTAIQIYSFILFSFLSIYFLFAQSFKTFFLAILFGILDCFTIGGGLLAIPLGLLILIYISWKNQKMEWVKIVSWIMIFSIVFYIYRNLQLVENNSINSFSSIFTNPLRYLNFFFLFLGNSFKHISIFGNHTIIQYLSGIAIVLTFLYLLKEKYFEKNPVIFFFLLQLILISALVSLTRSGSSTPYVERYRFYGNISFALCILALLDLNDVSEFLKLRANHVIFTLLVCITLSLNVYKNLGDAKKHSDDRKYSLAIYQSSNGPYQFNSPQEVISAGLGFGIYTVDLGVQRGMYTIPEKYSIKHLPRNKKLLNQILEDAKKASFDKFYLEEFRAAEKGHQFRGFLQAYRIPTKKMDIKASIINQDDNIPLDDISISNFSRTTLHRKHDYLPFSPINLLEIKGNIPREINLQNCHLLIEYGLIGKRTANRDTIFNILEKLN